MLLNGFFTYLQYEKRYSLNTVEAYRRDITAFSEFLITKFSFTDPDLTGINHRHVRAWVVEMMDAGMSARSVNRKVSALKTYFKYLTRKGEIRKNPMVKVTLPKTEKPLPLFVEKKAMDELFRLIEHMYPSGTEEENFARIRDRFIIELLYGTGMRRGELIGLTDNSIDAASKTVKVLGKGNKERIIPVGKPLLKTFHLYLSERKRLFGNTGTLIVSVKGGKVYPKMIWNIIHRLLESITTLTRKSPHVLRHTFATHLSNNGAGLNAVKELLGHASLASTQVYTHNTIDRLKEIHRLAHPRG